MKKSTKLALAAALLVGSVSTSFAGNEQTADEARERLGKLKDFFAEKGLSGFDFLNGLDGAGDSKNRTNLGGLNWNDLRKSDDSKGVITCIQNGKYAVNQMDPRKVGRVATVGTDEWRDGQGMPMIPEIEKAFQNSPDGWVSVDYVETTAGVNNEREGLPMEGKFKMLAVNSKELGVSGDAFFCATRYIPMAQTDRDDHNDRLRKPDHEDLGHKKHHRHGKKHHHAKKHAVAKTTEHKEAAPAEKAKAE